MTDQNQQDQGPWTEDEIAAFEGALASCRDSLPPRQRDAFDAILAVAAAQAGGHEVRGYVHPVLWGMAAGAIVQVAREFGVFSSPDWAAMAKQVAAQG
jgi:hypothetical protein